MFKLTFQYFNRHDDRIERTVHGQTSDDAYAAAYEIALKDGDGDVSVVSIYDMRKMIRA